MNFKYLDEKTLELCLFKINEKDVKEALLREDAFVHVDSRHFVGARRAYHAAEENASGMHGSFWLPNGTARFHSVEELRQWIIQILNVFGYEDFLEVLEEKAYTEHGRSLKSMLDGNGIDIEFPCARAGLVYFSDHRSPEVASSVRLVFKWGQDICHTGKDGLMLATAYPVL